MTRTHLIGLLLGTEDDWPSAFEQYLRRLGPRIDYHGETHEVATERVTIEPFDLRQPVRHSLIIDRLAYWYDHPREWLKKIALVDGPTCSTTPSPSRRWRTSTERFQLIG
jgi:hypothetical protein